MTRRDLPVMALLLGLSAACSRRDIDDDEERLEEVAKARPDAGAAPGRRVHLHAEVVLAAGIKTSTARRDDLGATLDLPGEITSDPDRTAQVSSALAGQIMSVRFREGQSVKRGDLLALVKVPELGKALASFSATSAKAAAARTNAERVDVLAERRLAGSQEALGARAEASALAAEAQAAEQQLRALGIGSHSNASLLTLRAPVDGTIIWRHAVVGQPVLAHQAIATIADLAEVWFVARLFERNLARIERGATAEVRLNAYPDQWFGGSIDYIASAVDPASRTLTARIRLTGRGELLRIGLFGNARVAVDEPAGAQRSIVVPRSAVADLRERPVMFIRRRDGSYEVRDVLLGTSAAGKVQVLDGIEEGEDVVVDGVFTLKGALLKSTLEDDD